MAGAGADAEPFRIGFLDEGLMPDDQVFDDQIGAVLRFRFGEAVESGELDRPVELVVRSGRGLPGGTAKAVCDAWQALADDGVLAIIGPGITDNCIAVLPLFETQGIATINFPGTVHSRGRYGFQYQIGSLHDDGPLIAAAIARRGLSTVAVIRDQSPIGAEFFEGFDEACAHLGVSITGDVRCSPVATDLSRPVAEASSSSPDALAYLGYGGVLVELSRALTGAGWDPPRFTTSAGMHFHSKSPSEQLEMDGWVYVDQIDEDNETFTAMLDRYEAVTGRRPFGALAAGMYDMATLAVLGLRHATVHTPQGVCEGLERVHQVPSALGGARTVMGFGPWERTALKGPDYLLLRQMRGNATVKYTG